MASLTSEDGWYLGNVAELAEGEVDAVGEVTDGEVAVLVGVVLPLPQPATSPTARTVTTSNPTRLDPAILFTPMLPFLSWHFPR